MNGSPLHDLFDVLTQGLAQPRHAWEAALIALSVLVALVLAGVVRRRVEERLNAAARASIRLDVLQFSIEGARRLSFPITALALLGVGEVAMRAAHLVSGAEDARLLHLAMALLGALGLVRLLVYGLRRALVDMQLVAVFERAIALLIWGVSALYVTGALRDVVDWLEGTLIPIGRASVSLWAVITAVMTTFACLLAAMWVASMIDSRLAATPGLDRNFKLVLGRVLRAVLILVSLLLALSLSGIDLTVLSVFGGALGVGLGLGLQRIAGNYVSGFILLLDRSLRIGDQITVDRFSGSVSQINTRYTLLRGLDGTETVIPNEMLVSAPVVNYSLTERSMRLSVRISIAYESDLDCAMRLATEAAGQTPRVLADPPAATLLVEFAADGLLLEVGFWIGDPEQGRSNVQSDVAVAVYKRFCSAGISVPYPRRDVRVLGGPAPARPLA